MPEFLQDPSVLTKEKLKSELVANNVTLPSGEQRKDVYVQLYLQHLTSQNRATPDFSSDEEREATPMRGRGRPPGRKATKKTDKPRAEEKDDPDVTELSNEALKEELLKYGMKPGPILSNTRKLYEQRLLKLREQGLESSAPPADSSKADNKQNGNTDSEHYSDKEEEAKIELTFEKREPLRGKSKTQVMRNRRTEKTEAEEDTDLIPELNVKRSNRSPPKGFTLDDVEDLSTDYVTVSEDVVTEAAWTSGPAKSGPVQTVYKELAKVTRRTPRKKVVAPDPVPFDDADIAEVPPISESVVEPASNQILTYAENEHFESRKVVNQVPESLKHAETLLSVSEFSELTRRTSKKPLISEKHLNLTRETDSGSSQIRLIDVHSIGFTNPTDLLNTALIEIVEKTFEERRTERDILKEMFPTEFSTPTGISASCRRPIRGAAGRPLNATDLKINETYTSKYVSNVSKYTPAVEVKSEKVKPGRSLPVWIKILMFLILVVFCFLVYQAMETNEGMSFSKLLLGITESNKTEN
ncbi:thymopoietin L homeolog isoform X2 [Xenopus laevis]|uniref:Thymopoietin L homeolog isoform X2 n=1 Tax=Xenopus laevis TaxID=8355 RepID=A0A8J1MGL8_XENLA|nr:thymopoietin L homeolog isoform X2 [Xenopus laevis]